MKRALDIVPHEIVPSMHVRKQRFFEESDGFVILPGGIGTLEEIVELLSWRRLDLHHMPVVFYSPTASGTCSSRSSSTPSTPS